MRILNKIGFAINNADMIHHYSNIWQLLDREEFDIIVLDDNELVIDFCSERYNYITYSKLIEEKFKYKYLVTHQFFGFVNGLEENGYLIKRLGLINIRLMYALGKNKWHFAEWNNIYDIILCFGPYQVEQLKKYQRPIKYQVGYPRYDKYFEQESITDEELNFLSIDRNKQTIVWLPTYDKLSSIDLFAESISHLSEKFNLIVKPHPGTLLQEPDRVELLESLNFTKFLKQPYDNLKLYQIADLVISDYGGTAFGAIYTDNNLVLLNVSNIENDLNLELDSSDLDIRENILNVGQNEFHLITKLLADEHYWEKQKEYRKELRNKYFAEYYKNSSNEVVKHLRNLDNLFNERTCNNLTIDEEYKIKLSEKLIESEKYNEAKEWLEDILSYNKTSIEALIDLAVVNILTENFEQAENLLRSVLDIDPDNKIALENLQYVEQNGFINAI